MRDPAIATASQVTSGDCDGWHNAWLPTAERLEVEAHASRPVSARDGLLRASTYYRAAEFFLHGNPHDPRIDHACQRGVACFRDAIAHLRGITRARYLARRPIEVAVQYSVLIRDLHGRCTCRRLSGPRWPGRSSGLSRVTFMDPSGINSSSSPPTPSPRPTAGYAW
ncbi:hypothetical protein SY2F82_77210 [Streptomyces sp. Y2F8-2]|uniref:hypothetical protein n=1 Tax=Streptomyces sp. Y2F8-2 TaxID=2759675 RepID=UPI0019037847|nr:hypothetical protein [Streptomyces sp. Y2F8-2]GHK05924.1 hypothetical protein SY2F82_77210 [Streptomyces sp. Y2F8-2]